MEKFEFESVPIKQDWDQELPRYWFGGSPFKTHFMNAFGALIPSGERALLHVIKDFQPHVSDPKILEQSKTLVAQEHWHSHSHEKYNEWLTKIGLPATEIDTRNGANMQRRLKFIPKKLWMAIITLAEHNAAVFFQFLLARKDLLEQMHPHFRQTWQWHGIEEIEHKGVALDMWYDMKDRLGFSELLLRTVGLFLVSGIFNGRVLRITCLLLIRDKQFWKWRTLRDGMSFLFGRRGMVYSTFLPWIAFMKPGYHPWDHDTRPLLAQFTKTLDTGTI